MCRRSSTIDRQLLLDARAAAAAVFVGSTTTAHVPGPDLLAGADATISGYALGTVPTSIALALLMALWVNRNMRGRGLLRLAFFTPTVLPMIAVANIWLFFYTPDYGLLDQIARRVRPAGMELARRSRAPRCGCLIVMVIWKEAGFFMIFYLAALQQLSPELDEAAAVEGASRWYIFRRITFPLLMPTTLFVAINAVINSFRWSTTSSS